ncbi:hypothetical protein B0H11DRAFT_2279147 [Mycena galericulata]|nr:hypothetical protein B0H11DRAFT_2279147 [Mycena galericulata]
MTASLTTHWAGYEDYKKKPRIHTLQQPYNAPYDLKVLEDFAYAAEVVFLDFEALFQRLGNTTAHRCGRFPTLDALSSIYPILDDLYSAHHQCFEAASTVTRDYTYYLYCRRKWDPTIPALWEDPETALQKFYKGGDPLRESIGKATACWKETRHQLQYELGVQLRMSSTLNWVLSAESVVLPWLPDSQCRMQRMLLTDIPNIVSQAQWHLSNFCELYEKLENCVKHPDSASIPATERLLSYINLLFNSYRFGLAASTGWAQLTNFTWK